MADEEFDGTDMVFYLLGEGQRGAHEARKALPQGGVELFDMIGVPRWLRDGFVALRRNDAFVHFILVRVKDGVLLIDRGALAPQGFGTLAATMAHVKRHNLTRCGVHGQPDPLLVGLLLHKAPHCVGFSLELVNQYWGWTGGEPHMEMSGAAGKAFHPEVQQPRQADAHRAANPAQGDALAQEVGNLRPSLGRNAKVCSAGAKLALAIFAQMMLFAMASMAIFLVPC